MTYVLSRSVTLQVRLDRLVLLVEVGQVRDQVLDHVHVRQWVDARLLGGLGRNAAYKLASCFNQASPNTYINKQEC